MRLLSFHYKYLTPSESAYTYTVTLEFVNQVEINFAKMKCVLLVVLLAAAATAAVVSNDVRDVADDNKVAEVDVNEMPEVIVSDVHELAHAADVIDDFEETAVESRRNLSQGTIGSSDVQVHFSNQRANAIAGQIVQRDIPVRTNRRITAIRVTRVGASQNATPSIVNGGIGQSSVTIRIRSAVGRGFNYRVEVYGR